jgi:protein-S-isoprenylcysteine O-methyltransferase Ste14
MSTSDAPAQPSSVPRETHAAWLFKVAYRAFGCFGLMSVVAALLWGFRYDASASWLNYAVNVLLYSAFIAPHLFLTRADVKESVWGRLSGTIRERQLYITFTVVTWLLVFWLHRPVPGGAIDVPVALRFAAFIGFLWSMLWFYEGMTPAALDGLLGVPDSAMRYSHGADTPLLTEGQYAQVRHPMYRAVLLMGASALIVHPHCGQLLWTAMLGATFIGFIPIEEAQLRAARGEEYERYCQRTPYRLFRGIW